MPLNNKTSFWALINSHNIEIPSLQRDYVQGYDSDKINQIRKRFLDAIFSALYDDKFIELDFVYGYTIANNKNESNYIPLDGQQRLTTLFLLHWYVCYKEDITDIDKLSKFSYTTRHSTEVFCNKLISNKVEEYNGNISDSIKNQKWYFDVWNQVPSIHAMLNTLNDIELRYIENRNTWELLNEVPSRISFYNLPMERFGLSDELYIKMNSRGKGLTDFEYFKSIFPNFLNSKNREIFIRKIDKEWSDGFWNFYKIIDNKKNEDLAIKCDAGIMRFVSYIINLLMPNKWFEADHIPHFEEQIKECFKNNDANAEFLFKSLDTITSVSLNSNEIFDELFYYSNEDIFDKRVRLFFQSGKSNLLMQCFEFFTMAKGANQFVIGEQLMLYGFLLSKIYNSEDYNNRARTLRNLIEHSQDYLRKENLPALLENVVSIIMKGKVAQGFSFNKYLLKEENDKQEFIKSNSNLLDSVIYLENHKLLKGCLYIIGLNSAIISRCSSFYKLFSQQNNYITISTALLGTLNYYQDYSWNWRMGSAKNESWEELFEPSERRHGIERTKEAILYLLDNNFTSISQLKDLIKEKVIDYENKKLFAWQYYILKYDIIQDYSKEDCLGFFYWPNKEIKTYDLVKIRKTTTGSYHWQVILLAIWNVAKNEIELGDYGHDILIKNKKLKSVVYMNSQPKGFSFYSINNDNKLYDRINQFYSITNGNYSIKQNANGVDIEDRILKGLNLINEVIALE